MAKISSLAAPRCGSGRIVKNGKNACGQPQFCYQACGACRVLTPKSRQATTARQGEVLRAVAFSKNERMFG